jgi:phosphonate transport system substrate-binding protein
MLITVDPRPALSAPANMLKPTQHPTRRRLLAGAATCLLAVPAGRALAQTRRELALAVVPQFPAAVLHRDWAPLLDRLTTMVGVDFRLQLQPTIPRFEADVLAGAPDLAYLNPYHQVMAHRAQGYLPLVRSRVLLSGVLVVQRDDPITSVRALDGKTLAFPAPNAFGASLWMRALLTERDKIRFNANYVQTHGNVYRHVLSGQAAAGGGVNHTLTQERDEVRQGLRVLYETPGVAPHPLSAHPRVPAALRQSITDALVDLASRPDGQALLRSVEIEGLLRADHARDYAPLEAIGLDRYVVRAPTA